MNEELKNNVQVTLVYTKEDEGIMDIPKFLSEFVFETGITFDLKTYNPKSSNFTEKRTANSLLSKHGTTNTPLMLFSKEGVVVRALYKEEHKSYDCFEDAFVDKYYAAKVAAVPAQLIEEEFE